MQTRHHACSLCTYVYGNIQVCHLSDIYGIQIYKQITWEKAIPHSYGPQ